MFDNMNNTYHLTHVVLFKSKYRVNIFFSHFYNINVIAKDRLYYSQWVIRTLQTLYTFNLLTTSRYITLVDFMDKGFNKKK